LKRLQAQSQELAEDREAHHLDKAYCGGRISRVGWLRSYIEGRVPEDRDLKPPNWPIYDPAVPLTTDPVIDANEYNALQIADAYACVRVLADSVSSLPVQVYRGTGGGKTLAGPDTRLVRLLANPSPGATSCDLFSDVMVHLNVSGNAFLAKWRADGQIVALSLLPPDSVEIVLRGQVIEYRVWLPGQDSTSFGVEDILHIRAMGSGIGNRGLSPVTQCRLALSLNANLQEASRQYFANGSRPSGILKVPQAQNNWSMERIKEAWDARHTGAPNMHRIAVLTSDVSWEPVAFSADDSQFLQQRELSSREVARLFRVPSYMIDAEPSSGKRTYANVSQEALHFVQYSLRNWLARIERAFSNDADLCAGGLSMEFDLDGLLRGDPDLRSTIYQRALGSTSTGSPGWLTVDEVRAMEGLAPSSGPVSSTTTEGTTP
jgi:HK97 family phage portal protein